MKDIISTKYTKICDNYLIQLNECDKIQNGYKQDPITSFKCIMIKTLYNNCLDYQRKKQNESNPSK